MQIMGPAAGVKKVARDGEASMQQIWPQAADAPTFNYRNRSLETHDITSGKKN